MYVGQSYRETCETATKTYLRIFLDTIRIISEKRDHSTGTNKIRFHTFLVRSLLEDECIREIFNFGVRSIVSLEEHKIHHERPL
jgi:hypothetical protein